jgi:hypothetical protein
MMILAVFLAVAASAKVIELTADYMPG